MAGMKELQVTEEKPLLPEQRGPDTDTVRIASLCGCVCVCVWVCVCACVCALQK